MNSQHSESSCTHTHLLEPTTTTFSNLARQAPVKFRPPRKDKTKRKEKTIKEIQETAPAEVVEQSVPPKTVELPYMEVPPIEEKILVAEHLRAIREKEVRYKLEAAIEDDNGVRDIITKILEQPMGGNHWGLARDIEEYKRVN